MKRALLSTFGIIAISALFYHVFTHENLERLDHLQAEETRLQAENDKLARDNDALRERVRALRDDPRLAERRARESASMARPNEVVYQFSSKRKTQEIEVKLTVHTDGCELAGRTVACRELTSSLQKLKLSIPSANVVVAFSDDVDAIERQRVVDALKASQMPYSES